MNRRVLKISAIAIGVLFCLMLAAGLIVKALVSGSGKTALTTTLSEKMGAPVSVASIHFDLGQWFRLKPAVSLEGVAIGNPPGFGAGNLLEAKKFSAQVSLVPLLSKRIEVHSIDIQEPRIVVQSNAKGQTNVAALIKKLASQNSPSGAADSASLVIDSLTVTSGSAAVVGEGFDVPQFDLRLRDFAQDRTTQLELSANLFRGKDSHLRLEGKMGPISPESLPLDGKLSATIAPAEMSAAFREKQFGKLLGAPGDKARVTLEAPVKGDLYKGLTGPAELVISNLLIGKDAQHVMPLSGKLPATVTASGIIAGPRLRVSVPTGNLQLGKGEWTGEANLEMHGNTMSGSSKGRIRNVEINDMTSNFTGVNGKIQGLMEVPSYSIHFSGPTAEAVFNSLSGAGRISITNGHIAQLDLLSSIQNALQRGLPDAGAGHGTTPFATLASEFNVEHSSLNLSGLILEGPGLHMTGQGSINFNRALHFDLTAQVSGGVGQVVGMLGKRVGGAAPSSVPLQITGTVDAPHVQPNVRALTKDVVQDVFKSLFKK